MLPPGSEIRFFVCAIEHIPQVEERKRPMPSKPIITVKRNWSRPSPEIVARFADTPTGNVSDAADRTGSLDPSIKPVTTAETFCGPALTVDAGCHDNLAVWAALDHVKEGDVVVISTGGWDGCAVVGDLIVAFARNAGAVGVVTDGMVRDREGLDPLGVPVFAAGLRPNGPDKVGPGSVGLPIWAGGQRIDPGDLAVRDSDGVVVVPAARMEEAADTLQVIRAKEAAIEAQAHAGARAPEHLSDLLSNVDIHTMD